MDGVRIGVALLAGSIIGAWIAWRVRRGTHRRADDPDEPARTLWLVPAVAIACGWLTWRLGADPWPVLLLASLAAIDLDVRRLPARLLVPAAAWTALCVGLLTSPSQSLAPLLAPTIAAAVCGGTF